MKEKKVFYTEVAYLCGIVILAFGAAFMAKADFGVSMVVAPAYVLYRFVSQFLPFFSFGMAEFLVQGLLIASLFIILRKRAKIGYLFSFITAGVYSLVLDLAMLLVGLIPLAGIVWQIVYYIIGLMLCAFGVAFFFRSYVPPAAYELFVKEFSSKLGFRLTRVKTIYDITSCLVAIALSFIFFGLWQFVGANIGTVVCAVVNGTLITLVGKLLDKLFTFKDRFKLRERFE